MQLERQRDRLLTTHRDYAQLLRDGLLLSVDVALGLHTSNRVSANISVTVAFPGNRIGDFGMSEREVKMVPLLGKLTMPTAIALCVGGI